MYRLLSICTLVAFIQTSQAQDTFSIVAADSVTREVGSAGASCVNLIGQGLAYDFLGDLIPGKGAINTQSFYLQNNQNNARVQMNAGYAPDSIINWLVDNDDQGDASQRQYGIVGFVNQIPKAAAYTGSACLDAKYHKTGRSGRFAYSIQGNILLGTRVIDSMEARFIREPGDLKCKLMAAIQGANMVGADSRCAVYGTSSLFSFLKVSLPTDTYGNPSFKIGMIGGTTNAIEPIDSLQRLFNKNYPCWPLGVESLAQKNLFIFPNPAQQHFTIRLGEAFGNQPVYYEVRSMLGQVMLKQIGNGEEMVIQTATWEPGVYVVRVTLGNTEITKRVVLF